MDTALPVGGTIQGRYVIEDIPGKGEFGPAYLLIAPRAGTRTVLVGWSLIKQYSGNAITIAVRYGSPGYTASEQCSRAAISGPRATDRFRGVEQLLDALWQVSTLPLEAPPLPPFVATAAREGKAGLGDPARVWVQQRGRSGSETRAGEA